MSGDLTEGENLLIGATAAVAETLLLQPTLYCKNALALGWKLTMNPLILYRGIGASLCNEVGQMSLQFTFAGALKARLGPERPSHPSCFVVVVLLSSSICLVLPPPPLPFCACFWFVCIEAVRDLGVCMYLLSPTVPVPISTTCSFSSSFCVVGRGGCG